MAIFLNPNNPVQPLKGVYKWFAVGKCYISIYIGQAGDRKGSCYSKKGTLYRGMSELRRSVFTSNSPKYDKLDTDFIVGTAIKFFETEGFTCYWRHIDDDPQKEKYYVKLNNPILQDKYGRIKNLFGHQQSGSNSWRKQIKNCQSAVIKAEKHIFSKLKGMLFLLCDKIEHNNSSLTF